MALPPAGANVPDLTDIMNDIASGVTALYGIPGACIGKLRTGKDSRSGGVTASP